MIIDRRRFVAIAATLGLCVTMSAISSTASFADAPPPPEVRQAGTVERTLVVGVDETTPMNKHELADLAHLAKRDGKDAAALQERFRGLNAFNVLTTEFEEKFPESFVQASVAEERDAADSWLLFTEKPPAEVYERLAQLPADTEVRFGAPATQSELSAVSSAIGYHLTKRPDWFTSAGAGVSADASAIQVGYSLPKAESERPSRAELDTFFTEALEEGTRLSRDGKLPLPVEFVARAPGSRAADDSTVQGGRGLYVSSQISCTAGFTAERNNQLGIVTAQHCSESSLYQNLSGVISGNLANATATAGPPPGVIDIQWHRTLTENGHSTNGEFRATGTGSGDDRIVSARANPAVGSGICHWGAVGLYDCGYVALINTCEDFPIGWTCGLDYTDREMNVGGDSGGPWFLGNVANGILKGRSFQQSGTNPPYVSWYTRVGRVASNMDAQIIVTP